MKAWRRVGSERIQRCRVFDLDRVRYDPPDATRARDFFVVDAPDWVNVVPLTDDGSVILIRQFRFGVDGFTLEIPGGMCDAGESPEEAARRELLEETGSVASEWIPLGWVHPNPALQANRCFSFLARGVRFREEPRPDPEESIEVVAFPVAEIGDLVARGEIRHALVIAAFHLLGLSGRL